MEKVEKGKVIILIDMQGEYWMKEGLMGIIRAVDDIGQIHVNWENGSNLAVIPDLDEYKILSHKEHRKLKLLKLNKKYLI